ncbi:putative cytochrome P450 1A1-like isoform X2 [Tupanvirus deep ocean]|uniref:Cytochrome P450 1A1-like isoform X2 n=2 Tax=Tupanvirus TaxID=2094720 RepID=A0AC62A7S0_9VIRU|nr:putative cytochrome P450 1A1-like isoform X2 [Tupanvirus deep ocean]QKU33702.1 putative cytochrome P450 1A1-like isoform X2 [Tupanvirus deep ocean]
MNFKLLYTYISYYWLYLKMARMIYKFIGWLAGFYLFLRFLFEPQIKNQLGKKLPGNTSKKNYYFSSIEDRVNYYLENIGSMYYTNDGSKRIVVIGNYNLAKEFYQSYRYTCRYYPHLGYVFEKLLKYSIGANHGEKWLEMKKPLGQFFSHRSIKKHFNMIVEEAEKWLDSTFTNENTQTKNLNELQLERLTIRILAKIIYGKTNENEIDELVELASMHNKIMQIMGQDMLLKIPLFYKFFKNENCLLVDSFWTKWCAFNERRKNNFDNNFDEETLFGTMIKCGAYQDEKALLHSLYEIMLFNQDIMVDSFSNLLWNLASNDSCIKDKILEEYQYKLNCDSKKLFDFSDYQQIDQLEYLSCVINESARLNPGIVLTFSEMLQKELVLDNFILPAGTQISLDTQMINRDSLIWDNPHKFIPERFENFGTSNKKFQFHRFGLGPRKCLGNLYADYILKISILLLLNKFDFSLESTNVSKPNFRSTIMNLSNFNPNYPIIFSLR